MENAAAVYNMASLTTCVTAACNIIEEFSGCAEGKKMADDFCRDDLSSGLPAILLLKLRAIGDK